MTAKESNDFEKRYFDSMDESFKDLKEDIKEVKDEVKSLTKHVQRTNGRLAKVEDKVFPTVPPKTLNQLPPVWRDPQILRLITYMVIFAIIVGVIIAGLKGFVLPEGVFR